MQYSTSYYFGNRAAARRFARWASPVAGSATLTETEGYWENGGTNVDEAATVVVIHNGGIQSSKLNALAQQAASDFGEERVLRVTVQTLNAEQRQPARAVCTSDDPENHQGNTCPVHEGCNVDEEVI